MNRLCTELADRWPPLSPPLDYAAEAGFDPRSVPDDHGRELLLAVRPPALRSEPRTLRGVTAQADPCVIVSPRSGNSPRPPPSTTFGPSFSAQALREPGPLGLSTMRSILQVALLLLSLGAPARSDILLPGHKPISHQLVIAPSEHWTGRRIVAAPVRGFGGTHVVEPGVPFDFSSKYGTRLYVVPEAEALPDVVDDPWKTSHVSADIPVSEVASVPVTSPSTSIVTTASTR
jgi:hypothetical protein